MSKFVSKISKSVQLGPLFPQSASEEPSFDDLIDTSFRVKVKRGRDEETGVSGKRPKIDHLGLLSPNHLGLSPRIDLSPKPDHLGGVSPEAYRRAHHITTRGGDFPDPYQSFDEAPFPPEIYNGIRIAGFASPTPIQSQCWPVALGGSDMIAVANTGSGKTIGFLFPAFMHIKNKVKSMEVKRREGPIALVLAPTRELAIQIQTECIKFGKALRIACVCLYGGVAKGPQIRDVMRGVHIVIATPGRMNDLLELNDPPVTDLKRTSYLILDEADRMLDMGFEPQIRQIIELLPEHQTLMFTATWPRAVENLARKFLRRDALQINIGESHKQAVANRDVLQFIHKVRSLDKEKQLSQLLAEIKEEKSEGSPSIIVFANKKKDCNL